MATREELNKDIHDEIEYEEKKDKRKKIAKRIFKVLLIIFITVLSFLLYNYYVTTNGLMVNEKRIVENNIPDSFNGCKIIHFSDLHYGSNVFMKEVTELVNKVNETHPDIIVFTGDLIEKNYNIKTEEKENLIKNLKKLNADIGKYAVNGDEDNDSFNTILTQADFTVLDNNYDLVYKDINNPILITGLSSKNTDINRAFNYYTDDKNNKDIFNILIMHEPDNIDKIKNKYNVNIAFSGGNLNGMIYIPKIGGLVTRENAKKYTKTYYKINNTSLFISSGVATDNIGIRLFTRQSINFIRLAKEK